MSYYYRYLYLFMYVLLQVLELHDIEDDPVKGVVSTLCLMCVFTCVHCYCREIFQKNHFNQYA